MRRKWFTWVLSGLILAFLLVTLVRSWHDFPKAIQIAWRPLALGSLLHVIYSFYMAGVWWWLLRSLGSAMPFRQASWLYFLSALSSYVPGKVMNVVAVAHAAGPDAASRTRAGAAVVLYHVFMLLSGALVLLGALLSGAGNDVLHGVSPVLLWGLAGLVAFSVGLLLPPLLPHLLRLAQRIFRLRVELTPVRLSTSVLLTLLWALGWLLMGAAFFLFTRAFYPGLGIAQLPDLVLLWCVTYLAGLLAFFTPGGLGVREGAMAALLGQLMPAPVALLVALASRLWILGITVLGSGVALGVRSLGNRAEARAVPAQSALGIHGANPERERK